ncbi:MAG: DoxX family protein [Muribaculaceae bacterium]|nr:DoxX family protein [Muribaculaceae bacterium]
MGIKEIIKTIYIRTSGYSYTNLGRLFLRLFVGIMMIQFGVRQIAHFPEAVNILPAVNWLSPEWAMGIFIGVEIVCSIFIMFGFVTRLMTLPLFLSMIIAEYYVLHDKLHEATYQLTWQSYGYLPIMFLGIYFFILLVGPGKISIDYFLSLHLIHSDDKSEDEELEEV